jgi:hypothetical protein
MNRPFSNEPGYIELTLEVVAETSQAIRVKDGFTYAWLPKSVCEDWPDLGETGEVILLESFAIDKGLV